MIILGIDPGFAIVGFAILEANHGKQRLIQCGAITTQAGLPLPARLPQVKQAVVGYGKAEKRQVMDMTKRILNLRTVPKPDDAADAVAIALCHARSHASLLASLDPATPGSGRYEVRKK